MTQAQTGSLVRPFVYNANGDVTSLAGLSGLTNTLTYDPFGRLSSHTLSGVTTTYTVNALDQRMAKANASGSSRYVYAGFNQLLAEYTNGQWTSYVWNGDAPVAMVRNNQIYYIHTDHLGRPQLATNASRTLVWKASNYAFNRSVSIDSIGGLNLGYPGQYYDGEFGTWHNGYRDYLADTGKYLQSDPLGLEGGMNAYVYASGNPILRIDPLGLKDYTECETQALLDQERMDAEQAPLKAMATLFNNHRAGGTFDFSHNQPSDTFNVRGTIYNAAQFGNFIAGYGGAYMGGPTGVAIVKGAGFAINAMEGAVNYAIDRAGRQFDGDRGSRPYIDAGAQHAYSSMASGDITMCGCGQ